MICLLTVVICLVFEGAAYKCAYEKELDVNEFNHVFGQVPMPKKPNLFDWVHFKNDEDAQKYYEKNPYPKIYNFNPYHTWFYLFGEITETSKASVRAGVYLVDGSEFMEAEIDCSAQKYTVSSHEGEWRSGDLDGPCEAGTFDLVFKIQQPRTAFFMFNTQVLDDKLIRKSKQDHEVLTTENTPVTFKYSKGWEYRGASAGGASLNRVAMGKCIAVPSSVVGCDETNAYINARSSLSLARLGLYTNGYKRQCWPGNTRYYYFQDPQIHGNVESIGKPYCCCTDMTTGEIATSKTPKFKTDSEGNSIPDGFVIERCIQQADYRIKFPCDLKCTEQWDRDITDAFPIRGEEEDEQAPA